MKKFHARFAQILIIYTKDKRQAKLFPIMHQSIPAVSIPLLPPSPRERTRGICSHCQSPGTHYRTPRWPPGIWRMCFPKMDEFIGKDEAFVKDWLGLEKLVDFF